MTLPARRVLLRFLLGPSPLSPLAVGPLALGVLACCLLAGGFAGPVAVAAPPNILWVITDDQSDDMGAYGTPAVSTPRMDGLAAQGVLYTNAYTTAPVCSASRTGMITGVYQTSLPLGMHHRTLQKSKRPLPEGVRPVTHYFRDAGYFVGDAKDTFDGNGKFDFNFARDSGEPLRFEDVFDGNDWRQAGGKPWFVQVNLYEPHRPFRGANKRLSRREELELPGDLPNHPLTRADYADYLASIETADRKIGAVLDRLAADGLADNTIVFFFGDNGREFTRAKGTGYDAGCHVPLVVRVPEGLRRGRPDLAPGTVNRGLVSMLDVTAASIAAAGIDLSAPRLAHLQGVDMLAAGFQGRDAVHSAMDRNSNVPQRMRMIREGRLAYIRNLVAPPGYFGLHSCWYSKQERPTEVLLEIMRAKGMTGHPNLADAWPDEELYDLEADPYQLKNLAADPAYAADIQRMRERLEAWMEATSDRGGDPDPDAEPSIAWYEEVGRYRHLDDKGLPRDTTDEEYLRWWLDFFGLPEDAAP
ncbi:MAG: sulfatase [Planctomycetota bacterium]